MISNIGNFLQIFSMLSSTIAIVIAIICMLQNISFSFQPILWQRKRHNPKNNLQQVLYSYWIAKCNYSLPIMMIKFFYLSFISILLSFLLLIYSFIILDFSLQNVFFNSSTLTPLIFRIAASWASHEGSILFWLCLLQSVGIFYIYFVGKDKHYNRSYHIIILSLIYLLFGSFIYFTSNPFNVLSFHPMQGLGLNPMLQDIALVIHPPILYLGYVSYIVPFTSVCVMLITSNIELAELKLIKIFTSLGILSLTFGISLGSWWAYRELGWGGFWSFDPIENISLFPWLSGIALHHSILVTVKFGRLQNWTITLSIITFLLTIFGTFLVRSGLVVSIHSFASSAKQAIYLLAIFTLIALFSLLLLIVRGRKIYIEPKDYWIKSYNLSSQNKSSQEIGIIWGNIFTLTNLITLIFATIYPIICFLLYKDSVTIHEEFFINNFILFVIPTLLLISLFSTKATKLRYMTIFTLSFILTLISSYKIKYGFTSALIVTFSLFIIIENCYFILVKHCYFRQKLKATTIAMVLGHSGFGLLVLSITFNSLLQSEFDFIGKVGESIINGKFTITLQNIKVTKSQNYYRQIAEFWIKDKQNNVTILKPENRLYIIENTLSSESNIYSYLTYDLYAVLSKIDNDTIYAKIYYKPMMSFIWIASLIIIGGCLIGLLNFNISKIRRRDS